MSENFPSGEQKPVDASAPEESIVWRVGSKVRLNVYEGDRPVCQCHTAEDAARIVAVMNGGEK